MKKLVCVLIALALLCALAMAEGRVIEPMLPEIDLASPADGTYGAEFSPAELADGALHFAICAVDCYDIVDISTLDVGDTLMVGGAEIKIESLERGDDIRINGGLNEGGYTLCAHEEDNCWKIELEDDYTSWTGVGETTLPLADDVTFTDGWDIEKDPVTVRGAGAVADAINGTEMDTFVCYNTTVRVEGGKVVEIVRSYMP